MNNDFYNLEVLLIVSICTPMVPRRFDLPNPADLQTRSGVGVIYGWSFKVEHSLDKISESRNNLYEVLSL